MVASKLRWSRKLGDPSARFVHDGETYLFRVFYDELVQCWASLLEVGKHHDSVWDDRSDTEQGAVHSCEVAWERLLQGTLQSS